MDIYNNIINQQTFLSGDPVFIPLAAVVCERLDEKKKSLQKAEKEEKNEKKMGEYFQNNWNNKNISIDYTYVAEKSLINKTVDI